MFIRSIQVRSSAGIVHEYVRVVTSVRENGRVKQKVIANLGRRDTLEAILPLLERFLRGEDQQQQLAKQLAQEGPIEVLDASTWGPMLVVRHFFAKLGLWQILDAGRRWPRLLPDEDPDDDWPSRVLAMIANRLTRPGSEHALGAWLESDYVCDRRGSRYVPCWKRQGRVEIDLTQLQRWYRTLDHLLLNKDKIEVVLYHRLRDLFDFQPDLVFYDLTSTYFAGHGPASLAKHGYSRDGKPRNVQVVVGVVMVAGWPIAHHVWAGNTRDSKSNWGNEEPFRRPRPRLRRAESTANHVSAVSGIGPETFVGHFPWTAKCASAQARICSSVSGQRLRARTPRRRPAIEAMKDLLEARARPCASQYKRRARFPWYPRSERTCPWAISRGRRGRRRPRKVPSAALVVEDRWDFGHRAAGPGVRQGRTAGEATMTHPERGVDPAPCLPRSGDWS